MCLCSKATVDQLDQYYLLAPGKVKDAYLFYLLKEYTEKNPRSSVIVFTNTCRYVIKSFIIVIRFNTFETIKGIVKY